ncbi:Astacin-like metalloendopeptidase [Orchesella cincta]|uniref:Astacin-like metalloendopeptidase n=1 Tax=Orchesella cincta TaxID=48709 RepID=A0A1D2MC20_ORCCI|nr:Astacin-like metalloendopeptidase [Orchesella cincta]
MCSKGNAIHEILHALGFFHEQTVMIGIVYVVNFQNISPGFENNFKKDGELYPDAETSYFDVPYNYDSIMHYGKTYFSKNGANTIDVLNNPDAAGNGDNIGQRDFISEGDMVMLRTKYDCPEVPETEPTEAAEGEGENISSTKPTTKNPMCQYQPSLPMCKTK